MSFPIMLNDKNYFFFSSATWIFREKSIKIGAETQSEEYVPMITPINKANKKPLIAAPPKINMIKHTKNKDNDVLTVLLNVVFNDLLMISL